ncbi:motility associated factor glycosyltransferase family protein [Metasolibacillus meyeri]|uniref:motility associated factor glycosyltransferase family protein n=1 Tax=Metasolibacillus meyeri TaxID=1071052 RepID=UPI000D30D8A2|nr:6-hydroxymethylpterin diphosphokinase MptE-like protein [Metasolibacillus meyeri]
MNIEYLETKVGVPTVKVGDYFIHSKYNPLADAEQLAKKIYTPHYAHILFGYGCGYVIDALQKVQHFNEPILVIDPLFKKEQFKISTKHHHLPLYNEDSIGRWDVILKEFASDYRTSFKVFCLPNYDKMFPDIYKELLLDIKGVQYKNSTNDYTLLRYAKDWQNNLMNNLFYLENDCSGYDLQQKYTAPVVVAAGGPSLNKQLPLLRKYRQQLILMAAGSTASTLLNEGIEPDYVVSIDGGEPNYNHFKNMRFEHAELLYTAQSHPGVRTSFERKAYMFNAAGFKGTNEYLAKRLKLDLPTVPGGGSVAHSAFSLAQLLTSGSIALIGQDLAFTDNLTHAKHNINAREVDAQFLQEQEAFQTEGYNGELIWTTPGFYSMKLEFEDLLVKEPPVNLFFNCTEGGIKLNNYKQIPFQQFCEQFAKEQAVKIVTSIGSGIFQEAAEQLERDIHLYEEMIKFLDEGIQALEQNKKIDEFDNKTVKKLEKIDKHLQRKLKQLAIETIASPVTMKVMRDYLPKINETKQEQFERVREQTEVLYTELKKIVEYCIEATKQILNDKKDGQNNE